jgi:hypothetical protein
MAGFNYCAAEAVRCRDRRVHRVRAAGGAVGGWPGNEAARARAGRHAKTRAQPRRKKYGGGAAAQPDADGGTACLALIARTGAPRGAAPPHSVTIQAYRNMYKS